MRPRFAFLGALFLLTIGCSPPSTIEVLTDVHAEGGDAHIEFGEPASPARLEDDAPSVQLLDNFANNLRAGGSCLSVERAGTAVIFSGKFNPCHLAVENLLVTTGLIRTSIVGNPGIETIRKGLEANGRIAHQFGGLYVVEVVGLDSAALFDMNLVGQVDVGANYRTMDINAEDQSD